MYSSNQLVIFKISAKIAVQYFIEEEALQGLVR